MMGNRRLPSTATIAGRSECQEKGPALAGEPFRDCSPVPK
jgi:hypothetical protein